MKNSIKFFFLLFVSSVSFAQFMEVPSSVCLEKTKELQLKAGGGSKYYWTGPKNFVSIEQNPVIKNLTAENSGTYQVIIDNKYPYSRTISIGNSINASNVNFVASIIEQKEIFFSVSNYQNSTYSISGPNGFFTENINDRIKIASNKVQGNYTLKILNENGCETVKVASFKLEDSVCFKSRNVNFILDGKAVLIAARTKATGGSNNSSFIINSCDKAVTELEIDTSGLENPKIKWFINEEPSDKFAPKISSEKNKLYRVEITSGQCTYTSTRFMDKEYDNPRFEISNYYNLKQDTIEICPNTSVSLNNFAYVGLYGKDITYTHYLDGVNLNNISKNSNFEAFKPGVYTSTINIDGCKFTTNPLVLKESVSPKFDILPINVAEIGDKVEICRSFFPNGLQLSIPVNDGATISILKDGNSIISSSYTIQNYNLRESGKYEIQLKSGIECNSLKKFELKIENTQDLEIVKSTFSNNCTLIDYLRISNLNLSSNAGGISWLNANSNLTVNTGSFSYFPYSKGDFYAKMETKECTGRSKSVSVNNNYPISFIDNSTKYICKGQSTILKTNTGKGFLIYWYKNGIFLKFSNDDEISVDEPGDYSFEIINNCSVRSSSVKVIMLASPDLKITKTCTAGNLISLSVPVANYSKIQWYKNGETIPTAINNTLITSDPVVYKVVAKIGQCESSNTIVCSGIPSISSDIICKNSTFEYTTTLVAEKYAWAGPNNFNASGKNLKITNFSRNNAGKYTLKTTDEAGCSYSSEFNLGYRDNPDFFLPSSISICGDKPILDIIRTGTFTDSTEIPDFYSISNSNDQFYSISNNFISKFPGSGIYTIKATDNFGEYGNNGVYLNKTCFTNKKIDVKLSGPCSQLYVPDTEKMQLCEGENLEIPFSVTGTIKTGTTFTIKDLYSNLNSNSKIERLNITTSKSPFVIPYSLFKNSRESINYVIESSDPNIIVNLPNINYYSSKEYGMLPYPNYNNNATILTKSFCDYQILDIINYQTPLILDSVFLFKNNNLVARGINGNFKITDEGDYYMKYKVKKMEGIFNNSCLNQSNTINYKKTSNTKFPDIQLDSYSSDICTKGSVDLNAIGYMQNNFIFDSLIKYPAETKYTWFKDGKIISNIKNATYKATESGIYQLQADYNGCILKSDPVTINLDNSNFLGNLYVNNEYINPLLLSKDIIVCKNNNISFYIKYPRFNVKFELFKNTIKINELFNNDSQNFRINVNEEGAYYIKVSYGNCSQISPIINIKFTDYIASTISKEVQVCEGDSYYFYTNPRYINYTSEIYRDNKIYSYKKNYASQSSFSLNQEGVYYVKTTELLEDGKTCVYVSDTLKLKVTQKIEDKSPSDEYFSCENNLNLYFNSNTTLYSFPYDRLINVNLLKDGKPLLTSNQINEPLNITQSGEYQISGKSKEGCELVSNVKKVNLGKISVKINANSGGTTCLDYSKYLYPNIEGIDYKKTTTFETYKDGIFLNNNPSNGSIEAKETGNYTIKIKNGTCEGTSDIFKYEKPFLPEINFKGPIDICDGKPVTLSTKIDANTRIVWEKDLVNLTNKTDNIKIDNPGNYRVYLSQGYCNVQSALINIEEINLPNKLSLVGDSLICPGQKVNLKGIDYPVTQYEFTLNDKPYIVSSKSQIETIDKGNFKLKYVKKGCSTLSNSINILHKINVDVSATDTSFCNGGSVTLTGVANSQNTYRWYRNLNLVAGATTNILKIDAPGLYNLNVKGGDCESFSKTFSISEKEALTAKISGNSVINYGDSAKIQLYFTSSPPFTLQLNDGNSYTLSKNISELSIKPLQSKDYQIISVKNICGDGVFSGVAKIQVIVLGLEAGQVSRISVFPNPTFEGIYFKIKNSYENEQTEISIYNSLGKKILEAKFESTDGEQYIDMKSFNSGVYILKARIGEKIESFKIIKK